MKARSFKKANNKGFTLAEMMITALILVFVITGILISFLRCLELSEMSRNTSNAVAAVKSRMEVLKNTAFADLVANFDTVTFTSLAFANNNGIGVSYVDTTNPNLYVITVTFCWRQKSGLVIGEDTNLDGDLDAGEDANGNGILDSPVQIVTSIYNS